MGAIKGLSDYRLFTADSVNWCNQAGFQCDGSMVGTPQPWLSGTMTSTGTVSMLGSPQPLEADQQSFTWNGDFPDAMGVLYNDASAAPILVTFDQPQYGVGAFLQTAPFGTFDATLLLFGADSTFLGVVRGNGTSTPPNPLNPAGHALFLGAWDPAPEIYSAIFLATSDVTAELGPDFSLGEVRMAGESVGVPEPASMFLAGSALCLVGMMLRRRRKGR
jgi:hypothetical protein